MSHQLHNRPTRYALHVMTTGVRSALEDLLRKRDERPIFPVIFGHIAELCSLQSPKICSRSPTPSLRKICSRSPTPSLRSPIRYALLALLLAGFGAANTQAAEQTGDLATLLDSDDAATQTRWAQRYEHGEGVTRNFDYAVQLYCRAGRGKWR